MGSGPFGPRTHVGYEFDADCVVPSLASWLRSYGLIVFLVSRSPAFFRLSALFS